MRLKILLITLGLLILGSGFYLAANTIFKPKPPKPTQFIGFENISKDFPSESEETNEKNSNLTRGLCAQMGKDSLTYEAFCEDTVGETKGVQIGNSVYNFEYGSDSKDYTSTNLSSPYNSNPNTQSNTQTTNYLSLLKSANSSGNQAASALNSLNNATNSYIYEASRIGASYAARGIRGGLVDSQVQGVFNKYKNKANSYLQTATQQVLTAENYLKSARPYPQSWNTPFNHLDNGLEYLAQAIISAQNALNNNQPITAGNYKSSIPNSSSLNSLIQSWYSSSNAAISSAP